MPGLPTYFPSKIAGTLLSNSLYGCMRIWVEKWQESDRIRWRKFSDRWQWTVIVTGNQKMIFVCVSDGNDFVADNSDGDMLDEPIPCSYLCISCENSLGSVCLLNYLPSQLVSILLPWQQYIQLCKNKTLECKVSTCKVLSQPIRKQCRECDYPFCL